MSQAAVRPFIHPKALVDDKRSIGAGTRVWAFAHVMKGASVGRDCNVGDHAFIESGVNVGDRVTIKNGVSIWVGVTVEDDVFIGPNAVFTNDLWPVSRRQTPFLKTHLGKGSCIGANATVVCGHHIGRHAMVGAGAVVTADVPEHALVFGNPARVRAFLCRCREKLNFRNKKAVCAACGEKYHKDGSKVSAVLR